jgi:hypothetical protein
MYCIIGTRSPITLTSGKYIFCHPFYLLLQSIGFFVIFLLLVFFYIILYNLFIFLCPFWESPNNNVLISLRILWWCKKWKWTVLCSIYKWQFKRKWEVSSLIYPQTHLESFIILHRNRSYFNELQLLRNWI